ncbi:hypothetical protein C8F04DRAFT_223733 [Mycena alexandri]|uniref:Uncharacterized protein n=1 Tax=Mycena alexandri TaxID=1745969 RepID=A0AAD6TN68_9AGAR|nr:hypothetical protein C8F04DRAFT_223733 [Mycena alexandri]
MVLACDALYTCGSSSSFFILSPPPCSFYLRAHAFSVCMGRRYTASTSDENHDLRSENEERSVRTVRAKTGCSNKQTRDWFITLDSQFVGPGGIFERLLERLSPLIRAPTRRIWMRSQTAQLARSAPFLQSPPLREAGSIMARFLAFGQPRTLPNSSSHAAQ